MRGQCCAPEGEKILRIKMGKTRFPQTAPLILPVDQSRLMARTVVEQSTGGGICTCRHSDA
ncbi:hypothetical protein A2U01_0064330 [Trifolium medium]|uniref:Uncharacterized protein n=1 Tax=Trifolium medium TaxID=97028 RepID=A0A392S2F3_9FABA|nr:hypothetical protein [Trifolium medium]